MSPSRRSMTRARARAARRIVRRDLLTVPELAERWGIASRTLQSAVYGSTWRSVGIPAVRSKQKRTRRLTTAEAQAILDSDHTSAWWARKLGCAESTVRHIRTGRTHPELRRRR
jgi:hypothetical protein